jgi:hypothetical protein
MKNTLFFLSVVVLLSSCAAKKQVAVKTAATPPLAMAAAVNDGSSFEKAIVIKEVSEMKGVNAEYAYLRAAYPGYKAGGQSLSYHDKKPYDAIKITTADGKQLTVYFDTSNFFGKF